MVRLLLSAVCRTHLSTLLTLTVCLFDPGTPPVLKIGPCQNYLVSMLEDQL